MWVLNVWCVIHLSVMVNFIQKSIFRVCIYPVYVSEFRYDKDNACSLCLTIFILLITKCTEFVQYNIIIATVLYTTSLKP